jgi:fatty acid desaturase
VALLALELWAILRLPWWLAAVLCVAVHHRIGILLHEYMHGIPLRRYVDNLKVFSAANGLLMTFGLMEVFRGNHLAHHHWLNTDKDPGYWSETALRKRGRAGRWSRMLDGRHGPQMYVRNLCRALDGSHPYVRPRRVGLEAALSAAAAAVWIAAGYARVPATLLLLHVLVVPPGMCRGAMEHTAGPDDPAFANEYRVWLPMFNMNRHIHHHLEPTRPWYMLRFQTCQPRPPVEYWTHWYRTFVRRELVFMRPMRGAQQ